MRTSGATVVRTPGPQAAELRTGCRAPVEPLAIDPATIAEQLLANLEQAHEYRTRLAAQTAGLLQKDGDL